MSESLIKSDIFFVVTTVAVVIISIGLAIGLFYIIRILKDLNVLSKRAKEEGGKILDDVSLLRQSTENKAALIARGVSYAVSFLGTKFKTNKKKNK